MLLAIIAIITKFSIGSILLFILFVTHALIGAVELGTDSWIQNITGNILSSGEGKMLFVYTSALMFALRFCAEFIEKRLGMSPIGLLLLCAVMAYIGLNVTSTINSFGMALVALTIYGFGKTFFWPTMLAVTSDRFPRTGAVAISIMGGIGMLSAGLIGGPELGYLKDKYAGEALQQAAPELFEQFKSAEPSTSIFFPPAVGLDGIKVQKIGKEPTDAEQKVLEASITGDRKTLVADSTIPAIMAVIFFLLLLYFKSIGGYRPVHLAGSVADSISDEDESIPPHAENET